MKFEHKYPDASSTDRFEFEYSYATKTPKLGQCRWCGSFTKWIDILFQMPVCSEECNAAMWLNYKEDQKKNSTYENFESHFQKVKEELNLASQASDTWKDVLIVVHDQLEYLKVCLASIREFSKKCHLYIWDNASKQETASYLDNLQHTADHPVTLFRCEKNVGFIAPNNELAAKGNSPYIILLNSDTKVFENWDRAMVAFLEAHPEVAQVGYWGGHMGPDGRGFGGANGYEIDYVPGWCFCISRQTYQQFGLFDERLNFAYCEDADFSLRLKESGKSIYALHAPLVHHYQNKTIIEVEKEGECDVRGSFDQNHAYIKERWKDYLQHQRVMLKRKGTDSDEQIVSVA